MVFSRPAMAFGTEDGAVAPPASADTRLSSRRFSCSRRSRLRSFAILKSPDDVGRLLDDDAEFLRALARQRRIAERAYFLWESRAGDRWWDATSNWLEAERAETTGDDVARQAATRELIVET